MKKTLKTILIVLLALIVVGGCIGGYFVWRHNQLYIGRDAALQAALDKAGLTVAQVTETEVEFKKEGSSAWYELEFDSQGTEYQYSVDAASGEILSDYSQPEHAD
ncbi:MAG: PepSY domain-containing protein [Oscillospiraceae bacterium]|nr:PepSY domain-containing protein [Oscillospiraceae bacterium]